MDDTLDGPPGDSPDNPVPVARPVGDEIPVARPASGAADAPPLAPVDEMLLPGSTRKAALADMAVLIGLILVSQLMIAGVIALFGEALPTGQESENASPAGESKKTLLLPTIALTAITMLAIVTIIIRRRGQSFRSLGLHRDRLVVNCLVGVGAAILVPVLFQLTLMVLQVFFPQLRGQMEENARRIMDTFPNLGPIGFLFLSLMVAAYEELVFRGFLMTRLRRATGSWTAAVLISTVVFVLLHAPDQEIVALIAITFLSLVFSVVTIWRRSLIPVIVAHLLFDLVQLLYLYHTAGDAWV